MSTSLCFRRRKADAAVGKAWIFYPCHFSRCVHVYLSGVASAIETVCALLSIVDFKHELNRLPVYPNSDPTYMTSKSHSCQQRLHIHCHHLLAPNERAIWLDSVATSLPFIYLRCKNSQLWSNIARVDWISRRRGYPVWNTSGLSKWLRCRQKTDLCDGNSSYKYSFTHNNALRKLEAESPNGRSNSEALARYLPTRWGYNSYHL